MSDSIVKKQQEVYTKQFLEHGDSPEGTFNQNDVIQKLRFDRLIKQLDFGNGTKKLHDVGCGICDLHTYLQGQEVNVKYSGTDVVPEMKELALKKYPNMEFHVRDIINDEIEEVYDYVTLAGVFNLPGDTDREEWEKFTLQMISKMFDLCTKAISFNFLTTKADFYHPDMYYADPAEIFEYCSKNLSRHVVIDHSYPLFEFTVTVFKTEGMKENFTEQPLQKYLK
tara:strand:- start:2239 stop:2913 length:675 start_codon:yes stop_codon:yes gene_type:complete